MRQSIRALVEAMEPWDAREQNDREAVLGWIDAGAEIFRRAKPATPPQHLVAYFVVVDQGQVLLVDHKLAELWLPPGGHVEPGEHPSKTVMRECREELGVEADFLSDAPFFVTIEDTVGTTTTHTDVTLWYALRGDVGHDYQFDTGEFHAVRWFGLDTLPIGRRDPNLSRFLAKFTRLSAVPGMSGASP